MSVLPKLATSLERSDEVPNQILAREIAEAEDKKAVRELVDNLTNPDKDIQSDCIKVLYEIGGIKANLIADYVDDFVKLLRGRNNRLIWGGMTALGAIADLKAAEIWKQIDVIFEATEYGSAISQDWGVRVLAAVSAHDPAYEKRVWPFLIGFLQKCPPKDLPRHVESAMPAVNEGNKAEFLALLERQLPALKAAPAKRLGQIIRKIKSI